MLILFLTAFLIPKYFDYREYEELRYQILLNELEAFNTMRYIIPTAQARFQKALEIDQDQDGKGEFGFFEELLRIKSRSDKKIAKSYFSNFDREELEFFKRLKIGRASCRERV